MAFEQWDKYMVCEDHIKNLEVKGVTYGYEFKLQYPTYRGTYLSCIEFLGLEVDGKGVSASDITFAINGKEFLLGELKDLFKEYWFIRNHASLRIYNDEGLEKGSKHSIKITMKHRIPYTGYSGDYLTPTSVCTKELLVD